MTSFKHELMQFDPSSGSKAFATPAVGKRSATFCVAIPTLTIRSCAGLVVGTVGEGIAAKFMEYRRNTNKLPQASDILDGKVKSLPAGTDVSLQFAMTTALCYELRERSNASKQTGSDKKKYTASVDNFLGFLMDQMKAEMVIMGARTALSVFKIKFDPQGMTSWPLFSKEYGALVLKA